MNVAENVIDYSLALGKGIYSVGEDLVLGVQRTGQGLGTSGRARISEIGRENRLIVNLIEDTFKQGAKGKSSPLYKAVYFILENYYQKLPDPVFDELVRQSGLVATHMGGRMVIGKKIAEQAAIRISASIAASVAFKKLAKKLGVSAGASATGVGLPIGLLMMQGMVQRSSLGAIQLQRKSPELYKLLKTNGNLQFVYFLIEKPMKPYVDSIVRSGK